VCGGENSPMREPAWERVYPPNTEFYMNRNRKNYTVTDKLRKKKLFIRDEIYDQILLFI
jgi:hypothetical protein